MVERDLIRNVKMSSEPQNGDIGKPSDPKSQEVYNMRWEDQKRRNRRIGPLK